MNRVFEQSVAVGVVHGDRRRRPAKRLADFLEDAADRQAQFVVPDAVDESLDFQPERRGIFRWSFDEVVEHARRPKFAFVECGRAGQSRRKPALIEIDFPLDAHHGAFTG